MTTQTTPQKIAIKQRLRTDLGRSVGVTTATQLVWLTWFMAHLPTPRNSRVIKRTHILKIVNKPPYIDKNNSYTKRRGHKNQYTNSIVNKYYISKIY